MIRKWLRSTSGIKRSPYAFTSQAWTVDQRTLADPRSSVTSVSLAIVPGTVTLSKSSISTPLDCTPRTPPSPRTMALSVRTAAADTRSDVLLLSTETCWLRTETALLRLLISLLNAWLTTLVAFEAAFATLRALLAAVETALIADVSSSTRRGKISISVVDRATPTGRIPAVVVSKPTEASR